MPFSHHIPEYRVCCVLLLNSRDRGVGCKLSRLKEAADAAGRIITEDEDYEFGGLCFHTLDTVLSLLFIRSSKEKSPNPYLLCLACLCLGVCLCMLWICCQGNTSQVLWKYCVDRCLKKSVALWDACNFHCWSLTFFDRPMACAFWHSYRHNQEGGGKNRRDRGRGYQESCEVSWWSNEGSVARGQGVRNRTFSLQGRFVRELSQRHLSFS